jgi:hypothetical protein
MLRERMKHHLFNLVLASASALALASAILWASSYWYLITLTHVAVSPNGHQVSALDGTLTFGECDCLLVSSGCHLSHERRSDLPNIPDRSILVLPGITRGGGHGNRYISVHFAYLFSVCSLTAFCIWRIRRGVVAAIVNIPPKSPRLSTKADLPGP